MAELIVEAMESLAQGIIAIVGISFIGIAIAMLIFGLGRYFGYFRCG